jgi:hypothetical protein
MSVFAAGVVTRWRCGSGYRHEREREWVSLGNGHSPAGYPATATDPSAVECADLVRLPAQTHHEGHGNDDRHESLATHRRGWPGGRDDLGARRRDDRYGR